MQKLKKEFDGKDDKNYIVSTGGISEGAMIVVQSKAQPSLRVVGTIQENGSISWVDKFKKSEPVESIGLAKDILTLTEIDEENIESPYVNYPSAKGTIKCKVLYNDNDEKGLQIVSINPVTKVGLGINDPNPNVEGKMGSIERAQSSYNRAIITLNEKAEEYKGTSDGSILAIDARCIGSDPINKNHPDDLIGEERNAQMFIADSSYIYMKDYNGKYFKEDFHYETDEARLKKINTYNINDLTFGDIYWLGSRLTMSQASLSAFAILSVRPAGRIAYAMWALVNGGNPIINYCEFGLRPVFKLSPDVKIIGGEGTEEVPYEIGI